MLDKPIRYCEHLELRLALRKMDRSLPERIIRQAEQRFLDVATGYRIAVATAAYGAGDHLMMAAYEEHPEMIIAVTIHPLDVEDVAQKVRNGRWKP